MRRALLAATIAVLVVAGYVLANVIPASGVFRDLEPLLVDQCESIVVAPGTEDVSIDPELGIAFISAANRRHWYHDETSGSAEADSSNGIYAMSLAAPYDVLKVSPPMKDFLPHGIYLWHGEDGLKRLFVVNHPDDGSEIVEIFDVGPDAELTHLESIEFEAMHSPNDVVAVGPRQFYATNDKGYDDGILALLESWLALPLASVVYFDGTEGRKLDESFVYANGINQSRDGRQIYVAEVLKRRVSLLDRDIETGDLSLVRRLGVPTAPDNIDVAADGSLWIGGHPKIFQFVEHAEDESAIAPSHVIRLDLDTGESADIFIDTGGAINGSSVGAASEGLLIVGAVFDSNVMVCPLK